MQTKKINYTNLKVAIWLYFILLIIEGALRKWFLPFLASPLLIVRDPIALWLIYASWKHNVIKFNLYVLLMGFCTVLAICTTLIFGHGNLTVAIYGARILIVHFPVIFIIGKVFELSDVIKLGKVLLWMSIPMVIIIALQFYSPQSAWINRGVGGDVSGAGFSGAAGFFRPPGTFSFTIGNVLFFSTVACFVFYFWLAKIKVNRILLIGATISLIAAIPLSISRTLSFTLGVICLFSLLSVASQPKFLLRMLVFICLGGFVIVALSNTPMFQTATEVIAQRFDNASKSEGSLTNTILDRFFGGMITAISNSNNLPFFGHGLGMGTNAGGAILTGGRTGFLIAEGEWGRLVGEMGFVIGVFVLLIRLIFCIDIFMKSFMNMKSGNVLPWLLLSVGILYLLQGQWAQPTILGFSTLLGGLILASCKKDNSHEDKKL